ncbi:FmdB family zinc ribbon protein [Oleidesulfovibrio sp.]|uniref:FmdB family zinc ribbon protein n=1 Tax=Oleidesulfovibrio sp. TaxID=2909707 RepID=UPI003A85DA40
MPLFEFECNDCGSRFEELVRGNFSEVICPSCGSSNVDKVMSMPSQIPGTGPNRLPGTLAKGGGGPKMQFTPNTPTFKGKPGGNCGGCSGGSCGSN